MTTGRQCQAANSDCSGVLNLPESLKYSNVHRDFTFRTQLHNFMGWRNFSWEPISRTYYFQRQFASPLRAELEIVCFTNADRNASGAHFPLSRWKVSTVFGYRSPIRGDSCDL